MNLQKNMKEKDKNLLQRHSTLLSIFEKVYDDTKIKGGAYSFKENTDLQLLRTLQLSEVCFYKAL